MSTDRLIKCLMIGQAGVGKSTFLSKFPNAKKIGAQTTATATLTDTLSKSSSSSSSSQWKEAYSIEFMNSRFETVRIELDNCDISLDTCLHSSIMQPPTSTTTSSGIVQTAAINGIDDKASAAVKQRDDCDETVTTTALGSGFVPPISMLPIHCSKFIDISPYNVIVLCFSLDDAHSLELIKSKWEIDMKKNRGSQNNNYSFLLVGFKSDLVFQDTKCEQVCEININSFK